MVKILGISGSLRKGSFNTALLHAAAKLMPEGSELEVYTIEGIPLYNGDLEAEIGFPDSVKKLKDAISAADAVILASPEYNNSVPGVLKNAIDWVSRNADKTPDVFKCKKFAVIGASMGGFGTVLAQNAWLPILRALAVDAWYEGRLLVSKAQNVFDENGNIADEKTKDLIKTYLEGYVKAIKA